MYTGGHPCSNRSPSAFANSGNLAKYLEAPGPVKVTRNGETVGVYVPAKRKRKEIDMDALRKAADHFHSLIEASGATEDELVAEFEELRRQSRPKR